MVRKPFNGSFTQQEPLPEAAITAAIEVMQSGRLHRYNIAGGESSAVSVVEREYAQWQGSRYCLAVTSGGQAMQIALRAAGVNSGDPVLTNAFTLAPVPGAVAGVGAEAILVEIDENLVLDFDDLAQKAAASGSRTLLLSHMRGHLCDMDALLELTDRLGVTVIEDCAHTMGATWNGKRSGNFGRAACFSTQTYKHINSGEGGLLTSDDLELMAQATILSGSYMLYERHGAAPDRGCFENVRLDMPNLSARMDNVRAALLRPQLETLDMNVNRWNARYAAVAEALSTCIHIRLPIRPEAEGFVGSSIQFRVPDLVGRKAKALVASAAALGVELKWFGAEHPAGFTSTHRHWRYLTTQWLPRTDKVLASLFDMRLPLTFSEDDCSEIADIIVHCVNELLQ